MKANVGKISARQLVLIFIISTFSPTVRLFPAATARVAKQAAWLSPLASVAGMIILVLILQSFFKKGENLNLSDIYMNTLGNFFGKIVLAAQLIVILTLLAVYTRYYAERIVSSILPDTTIQFLIITMLGFVFYTVRGGLVPLARLNELIFIIFVIIFAVNSLLTVFSIEITSLLPISYIDALPVMKSTTTIYGIWSYFLLVFFLADKVKDKENIKSTGLRAVLFLAVTCTIIIFMTIGVLGSSLAARIELPYFMSIKEITVLDTLARIETITIALWVLADFTIIAIMTFIALSIFKALFCLSETRSLINPIVLITYILSLSIVKSLFELEVFSEKVIIPINIIFGFIVPITVFVVGKIRKAIKST